LPEQRPNIGAAATASIAHKEILDIGQPDMIRPAIGVDRDVVGASIVSTLDQHVRLPSSRISPN
jgi:hypothetical protein